MYRTLLLTLALGWIPSAASSSTWGLSSLDVPLDPIAQVSAVRSWSSLTCLLPPKQTRSRPCTALFSARWRLDGYPLQPPALRGGCLLSTFCSTPPQIADGESRDTILPLIRVWITCRSSRKRGAYATRYFPWSARLGGVALREGSVLSSSSSFVGAGHPWKPETTEGGERGWVKRGGTRGIRARESQHLSLPPSPPLSYQSMRSLPPPPRVGGGVGREPRPTWMGAWAELSPGVGQTHRRQYDRELSDGATSNAKRLKIVASPRAATQEIQTKKGRSYGVAPITPGDHVPRGRGQGKREGCHRPCGHNANSHAPASAYRPTRSTGCHPTPAPSTW